MTLWYAFSDIGRVYELNGFAEKEASTAGVHGYPTREQAIQHPNVVDTFSQGLITQWNADASLPVGGGTLGVLATENYDASSKTFSTPQNPATAAAKSATTGWTHNIEQWIIRGFEMLLGLGLIIVSLAKLASDTPAGRAAVKAGKAAMIL